MRPAMLIASVVVCACGEPTRPLPPPGPAGCGLPNAAFCDDFSIASPGGRAGDLDDAEWSVGRITGITNVSQGQDGWVAPSRTDACGSWRENISPENADFFFCDGGDRLINSYNDGGGFTVFSARIRRPFDFAGRTGTIAFDVDGRSFIFGGHGYWWNFMLTAEPEPVPYQAGGNLQLFSRQGIGIEFQGPEVCSSNHDASENTISLVFAERDYQMVSRIVPDDPRPCFHTAEGVLNHVEIHVSETSLEVWVADAGQPETLRLIEHYDQDNAPNMFPLPFTRGYVHLQHSHYNAGKTMMIPGYATYQWDSVAFDGPRFETPRSYEVPDSLTTRTIDNGTRGVNVGYPLQAEGTSFTLAGVDTDGAARAWLTLNIEELEPRTSWSYQLNGRGWHEMPYNYPGGLVGARALAIPVSLDEIVDGDNVLEVRGRSQVLSQIELTLDPT